MPFIPFYSSTSEFLLAQEWGNLCKYLIYLVTLYVAAHILPLKYGTTCSHKVSLSISINLVMKVGISSLTDSCGYRWKWGDQAIIPHRLNCKRPQKQIINTQSQFYGTFQGHLLPATCSKYGWLLNQMQAILTRVSCCRKQQGTQHWCVFLHCDTEQITFCSSKAKEMWQEQGRFTPRGCRVCRSSKVISSTAEGKRFMAYSSWDPTQQQRALPSQLGCYCYTQFCQLL